MFHSSIVACIGLLFLAVTVWARARHPQFKSVPTTVKTSENDTVLLPCYVDHQGSNAVRWWWDNKLLADSSDPNMTLPPRIKMWPNNTLQVSELQPDDTGEYMCQVVRPAPWGPIQQVHAIEVLFPPSVVPVPESGQVEVVLGDEVKMACDASGVPHPIINWATKGEEIQLLDNRPKLRFLADNRTQAGTYQCIASNGVGDPATADIELRILFPPEVSPDRSWVHSYPGMRAEISCTVIADPEAEMEWIKDGEILERKKSIVALQKDNRYTLLFRKVIITDFGHYLCRAKNLIGSSQQMIQLSGVANAAVFKPEYAKEPSENNYTLIWEVDSYAPIIEYNLLFRKYNANTRSDSWTKLIIPADGGYAPGQLHSKSYTLTGLDSSTLYEVMLLSRNRFGWSKPSAMLRFLTAGNGVEEKEFVLKIDTQEENILPAEVAAILRDQNHASRPHTNIIGILLILIMLLATH